MRRVKMFLLLITVMSVQYNSWAQTKVQIGDLFYNLSGANASVASNANSWSDCSDYTNASYIIPSTISYNGLDYSVNAIGDRAFMGDDELHAGCTASSIVMPNTIKTIGMYAFTRCDNLTKLIIPPSVESFGTRAILNCFLLRELIYLPSKAPKDWMAISMTYVPDKLSYSNPAYSDNEAQIIEMISFNKTEFEYTGLAPSTEWANNVDGYTASLSLSTLSGEVGDHEEWIPVTFTKGNESFTANVVYRYTVKPAKLTAKVTNVSREYGEENPQFSISYSGFISGEDESVLTTLPTISTTATKTSTVGDYPINVSGGSAANYEFVYEPGVLTINKAPLSAKVNEATKIYGSANPTFTIDYYGLKNDETAPVWTIAPYFETDANKTSVVGNYTVEALDGVPTNYELESITSGTLSITPAPLTIKAKTYIWKLDEDMPEFTLTYEGFQNDESNDVLTKQPSVTTNANKNSEPGDYEVIVSGAEAENYEITYVNGILKVIEGDPETTEDLITIKETGKTTYCSRYNLDFTNVEGIKAYTATGYDNDDKTIWLTRVLKVPARTGILLKGNPKTYKIPHSKINAYYTNMFKGNVGEAIKIGETDGDMTNYYLSGSDGTFKSVNGNANIGKNKAYLQLPTKVFAGTRSVCTRFDDEDSTTNINDTTQTNKNPDVFYNLQGQRVENLVKGIYIKNGKKVIIK